MGNGLSGVKDDDTTSFANLADKSLKILQWKSSITITGYINNDEGFLKIMIERNGAVFAANATCGI